MKKVMILSMVFAMVLSLFAAVPTSAEENVKVYSYREYIDVPVYYDLNCDGETESLQVDCYSNYFGCFALVINGHSFVTDIVRHGGYSHFFVTDIDENDGFMDILLVGEYKSVWLEAFRYDGTQLLKRNDILLLSDTIDENTETKISDMQITAGGGVLTIQYGEEAVSYNDFSVYNPVIYTDEMVREKFNESEMDIYSVTIDGKKLEFDQKPLNKNDRILVPVRAIFEALGYVMEWDGETRTAHAVNQKNAISIQIGNKNIYYMRDGVQGVYELDVAPILVAGRTLIPLRGVAECAGCLVEWNEETNTAVITSR
ncbi:MAG: copper amine oxidase N-terminal domain-containing protein [Clostridia bacterium]|nr:copper amine oxidase N-terminal domain-containing protein [Clostridia bacterium]